MGQSYTGVIIGIKPSATIGLMSAIR